MSNTLYFTRGKKSDIALTHLTQNYNLEKSFEKGSQVIFRGDEMLITLAKKYIYIYIYDEQDIALRNKVKTTMCGWAE